MLYATRSVIADYSNTKLLYYNEENMSIDFAKIRRFYQNHRRFRLTSHVFECIIYYV